jgi:drug/metabolite transporter (DMT)-like permease
MNTPLALLDRPAARQWLGLALAVAGAAFFATKGIFIKLALAHGIDTLTALAWRMIVSVPVFVTVGIVGYRRSRAAAPANAPILTRTLVLQAAGIGLLNYFLASYLDFSALSYITAQLNRLILLTYPFFVVLLGAVFFKRQVTPLMILSLLISYVGIALIFMHDFTHGGDNVLLGSALVLGAAVIYAVYQIVAKPLIDKLGAQLFTSISMCTAGIAVLAYFAATQPLGALAIDAHGVWLMLGLGLLSTVVPAYCISGAIGLIGSERTAVIGNVSPVATVIFAISILGEIFTIWHALGTALVLFGVWLFGRQSKPKKADVEAAEVEP